MDQEVTLIVRLKNEAKQQLKALGLDLKGVGSDAKAAMNEVQSSGLMGARALSGVEKATEQLSIKQAKYNQIVEKYGADSLQARQAAIGLSDAQARLAKEVDKAGSSVSKSVKQWADWGKSASSALDGVTGKAKLAGAGIAAAVGIGAAGIAALGASAVNTAADFEAGLSDIRAVSGATVDEMKGIHDLSLKLGAETAFSASESAAGIGELIKGGVQIQDVMSGAAKATLDLAAAGGVEVAEASEITANALAMFGLQGKEAAHAADLVAGAANASSLSVSDFRMSLGAFGAVANTVGMNIDDTASAIALMGAAGIKGSDAGTALKTMFLNLQPKTKEQIALFRELGLVTGGSPASAAGKMADLSKAQNRVALAQEALDKKMSSGKATAAQLESAHIRLREAQAKLAEGQEKNAKAAGQVAKAAVPMSNAFFDAAGKMKSGREVAEILHKSLAKMTEQQRTAALATMFGSDAIRAGAVLAKGGAAAWDLMSKSMGKVTAAGVGASKLDNLKGSMQALSGTIETGSIMIGEAILPMVRQVVDGLNEIIGGALPSLQAILSGVATDGAGPFSAALEVGRKAVADLSLALTGTDQPGAGVKLMLRDIGTALGITTEATDKQKERMADLGEEQTTAASKATPFGKALLDIKQALIDAGPKIKLFLDKLGDLGKWLMEHKELVAGFVKGFALLSVVGTVLGPIASLLGILTTLGGVVTALAASTTVVAGIFVGPLLLAIGAVVAVVVGLKLAWESNLFGIRDIVTKFISDLKKQFGGLDLGKIGKDIIDGMVKGFRSGWSAVESWVKGALAKLPDWMKKALNMHSPPPWSIEMGSDISLGFLMGYSANFPAIRKAVDELRDILTNRPDFEADYKRFWDRILGTGMTGVEQMIKWADYLGHIGDDSAFQQFFGGGVGSAASYKAFGVERTEAQQRGVSETLAAMRKQQEILKTATKGSREYTQAQAELERQYARLVDRLKELEDVRYAEAKAALEQKKAEGGGSYGDSALLGAMIGNLDEYHQRFMDNVEADAKRLADLSADEDAYNARREEAYQRIIDLINEQRDLALDAEDQVHDSVMEKLEAEEARREQLHDKTMRRLEDRKDAEEAAHDKAMSNLEAEHDAAQAIIDADSKRLDDLRWQLRQLEHEVANDPAASAAAAQITEIDAEILRLQTDAKVTIDLFKDLQRIDPRDSSEKRQAAAKKGREVIGLSGDQMAAVNAKLDEGIYDLTKREQRVLSLLAIGKRVNADEVEALLAKLGLTGQGDPDNSPQVKALQAQRTVQEEIVNKRQEEIKALKDLIAEEEFQAEARKRDVQVTLDDIERRQKLEENRHKLAAGAIAAEMKAEQDRWDLEKARIEALMDAEDARHKARMRQLQAEYALILLQADPTKTAAEIAAILEEQARRAEQIAKDAQAQFEEWMKRMGLVAGKQAPGGGVVTPPAPAPPGIEPPRPPGGFLSNSVFGGGYGPVQAFAASLPTPVNSSAPAMLTIQSATIVAANADVQAGGDVNVGQQAITVEVGNKIIEEIVRSSTAKQSGGRDSRMSSGV